MSVSASLAQLLEDDLQTTGILETLLRSERTLLETRDITALNALLLEKAQLLASIENNDEARKALLLEAGYDASPQGMLQYCNQSEQDAALYAELRAQLQRCAELTDLNGAIVHRSRMNTRQALDILRGKTITEDLYTNQGDARRTTESRALGKA